jgi:hypothetical protein
MTKKDYLMYKKNDQMAILYEFYKERFDKNKHRPFLQRQEFDTFAHMVMDVERAYRNATEHYDKELNITELRDKDGKPIMIL